MIYFDMTKSAKVGHLSGLQRVSQCLLAELGETSIVTRELDWAAQVKSEDWFLTAEVFSLLEQTGFAAALQNRPCRMAAVFHDAIPLKHPKITWPVSVARHPHYMKMLASFDLVLAVSEASRRELLGYWEWLGAEKTPPVKVIHLGANSTTGPRVLQSLKPLGCPSLLCVGIIEPRKNQVFLAEACGDLWNEGLAFDLHLVGRLNPHFGKPILNKIRQAGRMHRRRLHYRKQLSDAALEELYRQATATVFPTIAEGCGLPVLESLWRGLPCLCSDLAPIRENAQGGGLWLLPPNDRETWCRAIRAVVTGTPQFQGLQREARARSLPTWADTAREVRTALSSAS